MYDLPALVAYRVISPFHEGFIFTISRKKPSRKMLILQYVQYDPGVYDKVTL